MLHQTQVSILGSDIADALAGGATQAQAEEYALEMAYERHDAAIIAGWERAIGQPVTFSLAA